MQANLAITGERAGAVLARNRSVISRDWLLLGLFSPVVLVKTRNVTA